jgi:hypothetical protein
VVLTPSFRYIPHSGERCRLRIAASHIRSSQEFANVRRLFCHSSWSSFRPHRHHRQAMQPPFSSLIRFHSTNFKFINSMLRAFADARNCSIKVGGSSCAQNMWFSDSSILCKVLHPARIFLSNSFLCPYSQPIAASSWRRQQQDNRGRCFLLASRPATAPGVPS